MLLNETATDIKSIFQKYGFKDTALSEYIVSHDKKFMKDISEITKTVIPHEWELSKQFYQTEYPFIGYGEVFDSLVDRTKWISQQEREKGVIQFILNVIEKQWLLGYASAYFDYLKFQMKLNNIKIEPIKDLVKLIRDKRKIDKLEKKIQSSEKLKEILHDPQYRYFANKCRIAFKKINELNKALKKLSVNN